MSQTGQTSTQTFTIVEQFKSTPDTMILSSKNDDGTQSLWWAQLVKQVIHGDHGVMPDDTPLEFIVTEVFPDNRHMLVIYEEEATKRYLFFLTAVS